MKEKLLRSLVREELKRLIEFAPGKFTTDKFTDAEIKNKVISHNEVSNALDAAMAGKHASGRPFSSRFKQIVNEAIGNENYAEALEYLNKHRAVRKQDIVPSYDFDELKKFVPNVGQIHKDLLTSIMLFTGGNVASVRNPELFDQSKSKSLKFDVDREFVPQKSDYELANKVMKTLAISKNYYSDKPIYRGVSIKKEIAEAFDYGIEFNNWEISSFSLSRDVAEGFFPSQREIHANNHVKVILQILKPSFGSHIYNFSRFYGELEVVLGKKLKIEKFSKKGNSDLDPYYVVDCVIV
jgi:hypothetical protein